MSANLVFFSVMKENSEYMKLLRQMEKSQRIAEACRMLWIALLMGATAEVVGSGVSTFGLLALCGSIFALGTAVFSLADATRQHFEIELLKLKLPNEYLGPTRIDPAPSFFERWRNRREVRRKREKEIGTLQKNIQSHRALGYDTDEQEHRLRMLREYKD